MTRPATTRRGLLLGAAALVGAAPAAAPPSPSPRLLVLGDSWAAGLYADPAHALGQVAAAELGWAVRVDAVSGSGYLNPTGGRGDYARRAARHRGTARDRLVVVQGGSNDWNQGVARLPGAVERTVHTLRAGFPAARVLLLGPGPDPFPVTRRQRHVDDLIRDEAHRLRVPYVSMLRRQWIRPDQVDVLDPVSQHPTRAGQRYLGHLLALAIRRTFPGLPARP